MEQSSRKMGRPRLKNAIIIKHSIRFDKELDDRLHGYCETHGISMGEAARTAIKAFLDALEGK